MAIEIWGGLTALKYYCDSDSGEADMLSWDAEKRRLRTLTSTDAVRVQRLMGRSGGCSPGGSCGKRFQATHEASPDIPAFAVRPTRRTDRRVAPAAVRPPERPINLCRRSSASYMFFVAPPVSESQTASQPISLIVRDVIG